MNVRTTIVVLLSAALALVFILPFVVPAGHTWTTAPVPATGDVVFLYWVMFVIGVAILAIVEGGIIASVILFRERPGHQAKVFHGNPTLEFAWTVIPAVIVIGLSIGSIRSLQVLTDTADAPMTIEVTGHQWFWQFRYPNDDLQVRDEVHIPTNTKVKFAITAADVIHSFWVPALSGKMDAVPGRKNEIWMIAPEPGTFQGQCAEFCGLHHGDMLLKVVAEPPDRVKAWIAKTKEDLARVTPEVGQQVSQQVCIQCHSFEASKPSPLQTAPNLAGYATKGPYNEPVKALKARDPEWLRKWVTNAPAVKPGTQMPKWEGVLTPTQIDAVVAYLLTLK